MGLRHLSYQLLWLLSLVLIENAALRERLNKYRNGVQETLDFLERGKQITKLDDKYRDVILMVGNTGTGKSTLTQFVAGNLADLESVGTNTYVIKYRFEGIIGDSTTVSQTIYPYLVVDVETNAAFFDCPGYDDTRNVSIEIATTYFTKELVDYSNKLKIVLVTNYDAVRVSGSRKDFVTLLEHTHRFFKNINNYKNSIVLIATKVENEVKMINGSYTLVPDENVIQSIAEFFREYRKTLLREQSEESTEFNTFALTLVDILLTTNDGGMTYNKIRIFRRPNETGPLNRIPSMVEARLKIRDIIFNHMNYSMKIDNDFNYTLSKSAILKLNAMVMGMNKEITVNLWNIGRDFEKELILKSHQSGNFMALTKRFQYVSTQMSSILNNKSTVNGKLLVKQLFEKSKLLDIPISHKHLFEIVNQERYISFLQLFTPVELPVNPSKWVTGLDHLMHYLDKSKNWYNFLNELYERLSQYGYQKELNKYNVADVEDWGTEGRRQGIHITKNNIRNFIGKQKGADLISKQTFSEYQLYELNNLLKTTLKHKQTASCEDENTKLTVKGSYVLLSGINHTICGTNVRLLQIFASHTVFIDTDFVTDEENVVIIAPTWYIWGERILNFNGKSGLNHTIKSAKDGRNISKIGDLGQPGRPGNNAHNMVGYGLFFINADRLNISGEQFCMSIATRGEGYGNFIRVEFVAKGSNHMRMQFPNLSHVALQFNKNLTPYFTRERGNLIYLAYSQIKICSTQ